MDQNSKLARAQRKVYAITGFYIHFLVYGLVNAGLLVLNLTSDPVWWVQWPILGWGIGVVAHGMAVFGHAPASITNWQLRKIRQLRDRM